MVDGTAGRVWGMPVNVYCLFLHLSPLLGFGFFALGFVGPFVLWMANKDGSGEVDAHGRRVLNWIISLAVYWLLLLLGFWVVLGFHMDVFSAPFNIHIPDDLDGMWPYVMGMGAAALISMGLLILFAVIGALKANKGVRWHYPVAVRFLREE